MSNNNLKTKPLEESTREFVFGLPQFAQELTELAKDIRKIAAKAPNEATIATNFELKLYGLMKRRLQVGFEPIKEQSIATKRHVKKDVWTHALGHSLSNTSKKVNLTHPKFKPRLFRKSRTILNTCPMTSSVVRWVF
jgi:hypothetical protein